MPSAEATMAGVYDYRVVVLSVAIAILASYTALDVIGRVMATSGVFRRVGVWGGGTAMGGWRRCGWRGPVTTAFPWWRCRWCWRWSLLLSVCCCCFTFERKARRAW